MAIKQDLRPLRTKKMIVESFLDLLFEKPYRKITIQDIADMAMINRNTFYLHYQNKDDLLQYVSNVYIDELREKIIELIPYVDLDRPDYLLGIKAVFRIIGDNAPVYRALLLNQDISIFRLMLKSFLSEISLEAIQTQRVYDHRTIPDLNIWVDFFTSGYIGLITLWLANENIDVDQVAAVVNIQAKPYQLTS